MSLLPVDPLDLLQRRTSAKWSTFGADVLPLWVAEMDYALAPPISAVLADAVARSDTGYARTDGVLGPALAGFASRRWGWVIADDDVVAVPDVAVGAVEVLRALCPGGETVVISPPVYPPFFEWPLEAGASIVEVDLRREPDGGWRLDLDALETAFRAGPAAYLLCNPHNPVGRVHSRAELAALVRLAERYGVRIVADEIHAPLVLPGAAVTPFLTLPGAAEVAVSLVSASKAWNLAGLKCAAVVVQSETMRTELSAMPEDLRWRVGQLGLLATVAALTEATPWLDSLLLTLDARRAQLAGLLAARLPALRWVPPEATFLAWLDCTQLADAAEPRDVFLERGRVALEPGLRFGATGAGFVRLNFATSAEILDSAVARMAAALG